jgi:serine protease Do
VFSAEGKVIGTLIAGSVDPATGQITENHSFILPVSVIRKRLAAAGVTASSSATTRVYDSALDDFFADRYKAALPKFRKVRALYPAHPYVASYIGDSLKAIAAGRDRTPKNALNKR